MQSARAITLISRRAMLACIGSLVPFAAAHAVAARNANGRLAAIERRSGGRLGVFVLDTARGARLSYLANERFPMCSTFKILLAAAILDGVDKGSLKLSDVIKYGPKDLPRYAPVTNSHVRDGGMTIENLCAAAIEYSDNGAANLLLGQIGGPAGVTHFLRGLGDPLTRLDRTEPALNTAIPGDPRDTTSPEAIAGDMRKLLLGNALPGTGRDKLLSWMRACKTADKRLRAGLPRGWQIGSKTGTGKHGTANELAILWPPKRGPILVASYLTGAKGSDADHDAIHAAVGRVIAAQLTRNQ